MFSTLFSNVHFVKLFANVEIVLSLLSFFICYECKSVKKHHFFSFEFIERMEKWMYSIWRRSGIDCFLFVNISLFLDHLKRIKSCETFMKMGLPEFKMWCNCRYCFYTLKWIPNVVMLIPLINYNYSSEIYQIRQLNRCHKMVWKSLRYYEFKIHIR